LRRTAAQAKAKQPAVVSGVDELMQMLQPLVQPIDTFFDKVFVMVEEQDVRENRLALLQRIAELPEGIVDLTKVLGY
jgi:glycyl-tRNA synthetase